MIGRPRLWQRHCSGCGVLDGTTAAIAAEHDAEARLAAEAWACPSCGSGDYIAARKMEDGDLEPQEAR